jgi:putative RNA 2'-phosphotransferase
MGRQYVHLTTERELAVQVGKRKASVPEILQVDALAAHNAGVAFYPRSEVVWLAEKVPLSFIDTLGE